MINSSKTRLSRLNRDFEFSAYGYRFAPHTSAAVPVVQKVLNAIQYALEVPRNRRSVLSIVEESWPMFTLKHEGNILFFETNRSPPGADSEIV